MSDRSVPSVASSRAIAIRMSQQATRNTRPELAVRRLLHRAGLRYRVHQRPIASARRAADIVFRRASVAVFVDGCFWHGCPAHATWPKENADFWLGKITSNRARDQDTDNRLAAAGWLSIRVWEHEDPAAATSRIRLAVLARLAE